MKNFGFPKKMKSFSLSHIALVSFVVFFFLGISKTSQKFPPVNVDEITCSIMAHNTLNSDESFYSPYSDVSAPEAPLSEKVSFGRPLYVFWVSSMMKIFPFDLWYLRLGSVIAGFLMVCSIFIWGTKIYNKNLGLFLPVFLLSQTPFVMAMLTVNELILLASYTCFLYMLLELPSINTEWGTVLLGLLIPLSVLIHPFGIITGSSILVMWYLINKSNLKQKGSQLILGILPGVFIVIIGNPFSLVNEYPFYFEIAKPLILNPFELKSWIIQLWGIFINSTSFYFPWAADKTWGFTQNFYGFWLAVIFAFIANLLFPSKSSRVKRVVKGLMLGIIITILGLVLTSNRPESFYLVLLTPMTAPLFFTAVLESSKQKRYGAKLVSKIIVVALVFSMGSFLLFSKNYSQKFMSHQDIVKEIKMKVGEGQKILAPTVFWFDFPMESFRAVSGLVISRYYTNGEFLPREWMSGWRPRYVVANESLIKVLSRYGHPFEAFATMLNIPITTLGHINTGTLDGALFILELEWPE